MPDVFDSYVDQILSTTLLLDDGTRVKPIYIDWIDLTPQQRSYALARIKDVSINELKRLKAGEKLRLEFNEIPEDLNDMLTSLGGENQPDFQWVKMDPS